MTHTTSLIGKIALVTGAGGGIGRATALELASRGAEVAVNYRRSKDAAVAVVRQIEQAGGRAIPIACDVTQPDTVAAMFEQVVRDLGGVDIVVNNAGDLIERRDLASMTAEVFRQIFDVNVTSAMLCCQAAVEPMTSRGGGVIINVASLAAHNGGGPGAFGYAAAKAAVIGMSKGLAKELAPKGIRVNCVSPGLIGATEFHGRFTAPDAFAAMEKTIPAGRAGRPAEVAQVIAFLAGDGASYLLGETIEINGGMFMR